MSHTVESLKRRRRMFMLWSIPVVLIALVAGLKLISLSAVNAYAVDAYDSEEFAEATSRWEWLEPANWFEPWVANFNKGTAQLRAERFAPAEKTLKKALDQAPDERVCDVRQNLSLAIEAQGDIANKEPDREKAKELWTEALETLQVEQCSEKTEKNTNSQERIKKKLEDDPSDQPTDDPTDDPSDEPTDDPTDDPSDEPTDDPTDDPSDPSDSPTDNPTPQPEDPKQRELEDRNKEAEEERQKNQEDKREQGGSNNGKGW